jgi:hypothetical protein
MIGQVGTNKRAEAFLQKIDQEQKIANVVFVASGKLVVLTGRGPSRLGNEMCAN